MPDKPKIAMYWAASCGGCEISLANLHENLINVDAAFQLVFCPCLVDGKKHDVEALRDGELLITFFNGAIRTDENEEMARLLRKKSKILIAYGSCAYEGCIPGLSNFHTRDDHMKAVYLDNPSIDNPKGILPQPSTTVPEGTRTIPKFHDRVKTLGQTVDVDYFLPGCPPESAQVWAVIEAVIQGIELPKKGAVIGAGKCTVCDECEKKKEEKKVKKFFRTYEIVPDREKCLLEQGVLCLGPATRDGCKAQCPNNVDMRDQGAKMIGALGTAIDLGDTKDLSEEQIAARVEEVISTIPDYAGVFYKYSLPGSILGGKK
jgi:F420-non-reducing hydrogenase small subunit